MKKVMTFLLIALMANVGGAAVINIYVNGEPWQGEDVAPSDIIGCAWYNDVPGLGGVNLQINVSSGECVDYWWVWPLPPAPQPIWVYPKEPDGFDVEVIVAFSLEIPVGELWGWDFHVADYLEDSDLIIIDPFAGSWNSVYAVPGPDDGLPYVVLHVTPEPTTLILLGLGGLFMLRRRK